MKKFLSPLPKPSSVLIKNAAFVLTESGTLKGKSVFVDERRIADIGEYPELVRKHGSADQQIDASGCMVMPGLINNHSHIAMSLLRGFAEDLPLLQWLKEKIWPAEARLSPEDILLGAAVGCVECLLSGTTSITSVYFYDERGSEAEALAGTGLRGILAHGVFDWTREAALRKTAEYVKEWHGYDEGRIRIATSPHAPYTCSPELLKEIENLRVDLNTKYGETHRVMNTLHVAEARTEAEEIENKYKVSAKKGIASYLDSIGVLTSETIAAHSIHLTEQDYAAFQRTGASIASCPISNLKVGMGVADLPKLMSAGITVSLGTDGPASNNTLDMFETMKMASLLPKGVQGDTALMSARQTFEAATIGGARSMHQQKEIGSITTGKRADILVVELSKIHSFPLYDPYSHLVFSAKSSDVRDVIVDGRILVDNKAPCFVDIPKLKEEVSRNIRSLDLQHD